MKKVMFSMFMAGSLLALNTVDAADKKEAYVDMSEVFKNYYKTAENQKTLERREDVIQEDIEEKSEELDELREKFQELQEKSGNVGLSESARAEHASDAESTARRFQAKQQQFQRFVQEKQNELQQRYLEMRERLVEEITETVNDYADEKEIDLVYDVSGLTNNMLPVIIRYPEEEEITETIIELVNEGHEDEVEPAEIDEPNVTEPAE